MANATPMATDTGEEEGCQRGTEFGLRPRKTELEYYGQYFWRNTGSSVHCPEDDLVARLQQRPIRRKEYVPVGKALSLNGGVISRQSL